MRQILGINKLKILTRTSSLQKKNRKKDYSNFLLSTLSEIMVSSRLKQKLSRTIVINIIKYNLYNTIFIVIISTTILELSYISHSKKKKEKFLSLFFKGFLRYFQKLQKSQIIFKQFFSGTYMQVLFMIAQVG